jgi:hypothetical protein
MTKDEGETTAEQLLAEFGAIFSPPVLSTEPGEKFGKLFIEVARSCEAKDIVDLILARRIADSAWLYGRYTRHGTVLIERRYRQSAEFQAQQDKERDQRREAAARRHAEKIGRPDEVGQLNELVDIAAFDIENFDRLLDRNPAELDHNRALEASLESQERLDRLANSAATRMDDALELSEQYQASRRARHAANATIDAEYQEIESPREPIAAPNLAPVNQDHDDIPAHDQGKPQQ